ncbi:hypothetical protein [Pseudophaeobacter sp.]|uniref:hypothetical protein n=1 Tax=Pseudophaeobacter sp. TaxID=1971739 RepID=UPI00262E7EDA|nr:hypothetical protein [Pseudophaeobacter sp.]
MKHFWIVAGVLACSPMTVAAQTVPLYTETDGELDFTGEYLDDAQLTELLGGADGVETFGPPKFVARDVRTFQVRPVWADPRDYEFVHDGDGVIENRHDDLTLTEDEAQAPQEELVFDETETHDLNEDIVFTEKDGASTGDDLTFAENEGLSVPNIFASP